MKKVFALNEIIQVAEWLLQEAHDKKIIAFYGQMGAGKTTLIYTICQLLQVEDVVSSPTFSIINEYRFTDNGQPASVYHMDLYRLQDEEEAVRAGVEDCLYSGHFCFVEWPEKAPELFPEGTLYVSLSVLDGEQREIEILKK
ncbi:tRNA (adenosine(37)-N6)-threonylcarbamoyltransferase complex ATPase subunit type 1 TsaE [Niabella sp. CC-SYL272]|uniref:tRNA (adenosine(37)-N6)-threonylcarbamoyltransferase complex ATPase subunit type 1 TsaE n=1 Tax=Niabella agricola TaxID=2891571 RepID=UPI001EFFBB42|nr:tRNA (adenosine(37)-N6)-threonylcarbamoyltransferase complex ATPase subunit type 1 TsaE [Niabella agricola]MCF3110121.1 tRNA (adenosine(37)-N6)-threonylcarbamoyltransferase complex ATPase subunit type 1 TsaE [Niabella agricola]